MPGSLDAVKGSFPVNSYFLLAFFQKKKRKYYIVQATVARNTGRRRQAKI